MESNPSACFRPLLCAFVLERQLGHERVVAALADSSGHRQAAGTQVAQPLLKTSVVRPGRAQNISCGNKAAHSMCYQPSPLGLKASMCTCASRPTLCPPQNGPSDSCGAWVLVFGFRVWVVWGCWGVRGPRPMHRVYFKTPSRIYGHCSTLWSPMAFPTTTAAQTGS